MAYLRYQITDLAITDKRLVVKFCFISRYSIKGKIEMAETVQVYQTVLGRILGFVSLVIAGGGTSQTPVPGIAQPLGMREESGWRHSSFSLQMALTRRALPRMCILSV